MQRETPPLTGPEKELQKWNRTVTLFSTLRIRARGHSFIHTVNKHALSTYSNDGC